ncbi:MAG: hypothetical protein EXR79_13140 [Myxococcales bacterium]|nr:hypothetical protein [Myxococcales bacterium]
MLTPPALRRFAPWARVASLLLGTTAACREPALPERVPAVARPSSRQAAPVRRAAVTLRFSSGRLASPTDPDAADRLQVAAVFGQLDARDAGLLDDLVGRERPAGAMAIDGCVADLGPTAAGTRAAAQRPHAWVQLLDVGNVTLRAGADELPLRVQMVPSLTEATRGVRYDADRAMSRVWLAAGSLLLAGTGGDGVEPFTVTIDVPRPVRLTHVGPNAVRLGRVPGPVAGEELSVRWGSVDGAAELTLQVGAEVDGRPGWLRCRLRDDGAFTVPAELAAQLPARTEARPWLARLTRARSKPMPGFAGDGMRLELSDAVHVF